MKTILIVEDNEFNMKLFCEVLEAQGYRTVRAEYGLKGLRVARECRPSLILMDVQLPDVSGLEVAQWIKSDKSLKHIPIIVVTAFDMKKDQEAALRASSCDAFIFKPIVIPRFLEVIDQVMTGKEVRNPSDG